MQNQSLFVKVTIWFMIFLMSAGFVALVIAPFAGSFSLFGDSSGRGATQELVDESRAEVRKDDCTDTKPAITGARLKRCKSSLRSLAAAYGTLSQPQEGDTEAPRNAKRNLERAGDAYRQLYELDPADDENAATYAAYLRDSGKAEQSLEIFTTLVKRNPQNEDYLLAQASAYQAANKLDEAIATLRAFLKKFPESGQVEAIKEQIKTLQEQKDQAAAGGGIGAGAGGAPLNIG
ncbi:MAG: Tetratricopeptide repeat [Thermoleophilia bacterium]|nr:Tetratricopeptide repeat [Thermoleophilia bacterium]